MLRLRALGIAVMCGILTVVVIATITAITDHRLWHLIIFCGALLSKIMNDLIRLLTAEIGAVSRLKTNRVNATVDTTHTVHVSPCRSSTFAGPTAPLQNLFNGVADTKINTLYHGSHKSISFSLNKIAPVPEILYSRLAACYGLYEKQGDRKGALCFLLTTLPHTLTFAIICTEQIGTWVSLTTLLRRIQRDIRYE